MRTRFGEHGDQETSGDSIPFPADAPPAGARDEERPQPFRLAALPDSAGRVYDALDSMSRRIDDLARALGCLGYFDDEEDDGPRAA